MNEIIYDLLVSGFYNNLKTPSRALFKSALDKMINFSARINPAIKLQINNIKTAEEAAKILIKIKELIDFNAGGCGAILSEAELKAFEIILSHNSGKINIDRSEFFNVRKF